MKNSFLTTPPPPSPPSLIACHNLQFWPSIWPVNVRKIGYFVEVVDDRLYKYGQHDLWCVAREHNCLALNIQTLTYPKAPYWYVTIKQSCKWITQPAVGMFCHSLYPQPEMALISFPIPKPLHFQYLLPPPPTAFTYS